MGPSLKSYIVLTLKLYLSILMFFRNRNLEDIADGKNPPYLLFDSDVYTDIQKCEQYIEQVLSPPEYPMLACKHSQSNTIGNDIFIKFSKFVKFTGMRNDPKRAGGFRCSINFITTCLKPEYHL